jgi:hypothetical protein
MRVRRGLGKTEEVALAREGVLEITGKKEDGEWFFIL